MKVKITAPPNVKGPTKIECPKHPQYKGVNRPKVDCDICFAVFMVQTALKIWNKQMREYHG